MDKKEKKQSVLKRLLPYAGNKKPLLFWAMICSGLSGILVLMPFVYIHKITSGIILSESVDVAIIKQYAIYAGVCAAIGLVIYLIALTSSHIFAFEVEGNIIRQNIEKMIHKPLGFFANRESGKLRQVIMEGAGETHTFLAHQLPDLASTMLSPIVLLVFFFVFDWKLGLASLLSIIVSFVLMLNFHSKTSRKRTDLYYKSNANLGAEAVEYVRCIPVVKTFAQSVESFDRFYSQIIEVRNLVVELTLGYKNKWCLFEVIITATSFFLVPIAILLIQSGGNVKQIAANAIIYLLIGPAVGILIFRNITIQQYANFAEQALDKIDEIFAYEDITYGNKEKSENSLEFKNVSFSYKNNNNEKSEKILDGISFTAKEGETIALVGPSGGGKTTIARLASRFYDVDTGEILIGGENIKNYKKNALMKKIAFVFQNPGLFKMSLKENLLLGNPNASDEEIEKALLYSGSKEIVDNLEKGLDTVFGTKGTYFSGGEVQRLSIARAFLKNADLIILDEATAFADPENEKIIQASFKELSKNKTTLMIAHRLSTIVDADKILVIDKGKIVESGRHNDLLEQNGMYKQMWDEFQRSITWTIGGQNA
ncbi:MAG: ABC transporter ATP-binding protein [Treponemataceae bacterium]